MESLFLLHPLESAAVAALIGVVVGYLEWRFTRDPLLYMFSWLFSVFMASGFVVMLCGAGSLGLALGVVTFVAGSVILVLAYKRLPKKAAPGK